MLLAKMVQCHSQMELAKSTWHVDCTVHVNDKSFTIFPVVIFHKTTVFSRVAFLWLYRCSPSGFPERK